MQSLAQKLAHLMFDEIVIEKFSASDGYGDSSFGTPTSYKARIVRKPRMVRSSTGEDVVSMATIYLADESGVTVKDRVTMPDGSKPLILSIGGFPDRNGKLCEVIYT